MNRVWAEVLPVMLVIVVTVTVMPLLKTTKLPGDIVRVPIVPGPTILTAAAPLAKLTVL